MKRLWRHLEYNFRVGGLRQVVRKFIWRFRQWLWSESSWLIYRCDVSGAQGDLKLPLMRLELTLEALRKLKYYKAEAFPEMVRRQLDSGARCHGFFLEGQLANITWTSKAFLELVEGVSVSEDDCAGIFDSYTLPEHRRKGIYREALLQLIQMIRDEKVSVALIGVNPSNYASIKGIEGAGFQPAFHLSRRRRFGKNAILRSEFTHPVTAPTPPRGAPAP